LKTLKRTLARYRHNNIVSVELEEQYLENEELDLLKIRQSLRHKDNPKQQERQAAKILKNLTIVERQDKSNDKQFRLRGQHR